MRDGSSAPGVVWAKGNGRDIDYVLSECLTQLGAKQPTYPSFGTRPEELTDALAEVGFVSIKCEDRTFEIRLSGGIEELLEGWGAGPMRAEPLGFGPGAGAGISGMCCAPVTALQA
jgi:hypothetical protein